MALDLWAPLRRFGRAGSVGGPDDTDDRLLARFAERRDEAAFAELLRRHGPRVWGVCRRGLANAADAEDAFQATFLVLARKAGSVRRRASVASFLHGVALRVVAAARRRADRPPPDHRDLPQRLADDPLHEASRLELRAVIDQEMARLPEKYRAPLVLCYFDGHSNETAARLLGWPAGTVCGRLARARELLRGRLTRRGVALSAGGLGASLSPSPAAPAALAASTLRTVIAFVSAPSAFAGALPSAVVLAQGVLHSMTVTKIKLASLAALSGLTVLAIGVGAARLPWRADAGAATAQVQPPAAGVPRDRRNDTGIESKEIADLLQPDRKPVVDPLPAGVSLPEKEKALRKERYETARMTVDARFQEFLVGRGTLDILLESLRYLRDAELQLTDDPKEQYAALDRYYQLAVRVEKINQTRFDAGRIAVQDLTQTKYVRLDAEIERLRARMRMEGAKPPAGGR